jgi:transcriptional regulator with XRE-family HTH domain/quercetin dioxygenase-like cupin family protein
MSLDHNLTIGVKLRAARRKQKLSLRKLAGRAEVSPSLLSQIENGKTNPSVLTLHNIATALDVPITYFFPNPEINGEQPGDPALTSGSANAIGYSDQDTFQVSALDRHLRVLRSNARVSIELIDSVRWERLTPSNEDHIQFLQIHYPPGATSGATMSRHAGKEFGIVLEGELTLEIGLESYTLIEGDSIIFDSNTPHRLVNKGKETIRAIWIDMNLS